MPRKLAVSLLGSLVFVSGAALIPQQSHATFQGNNGKLIYSSGVFEGPQGIFVSQADGSGRTEVTDGAGLDLSPSWSPDGTMFVYSHYGRASGDIFVRNADGSGRTRITRNRADDLNANFSPDGTKLVFTRCYIRTPDCDIYTIDVDGTGATQLTAGPASDLDPDWSSDGRIAFARYRRSDAEIFVMNANGRRLRRLTANDADELAPSWSPDGTKLVFERCPWPRDCEIFKLNVAAGRARRLTDNSKQEFHAAWSPNGRRIAFARSDGEESPSDLFTKSSTGRGRVRQVTSTPRRWESQPDWQPLP